MPEGNEVGGGGTCPAAGAEGSGDDEFEVPVGGCGGVEVNSLCMWWYNY